MDAEMNDAYARVTRELSVLFRRARSTSLTLAATVHPDLDGSAYTALVLIDDSEQIRGADLAAGLGLDKSTVSREIARLESVGLVERVPDPTDGRARLVRLTESGQTKLRAARASRRERFYTQLAQWDPDDVESLARLLHRLNERPL